MCMSNSAVLGLNLNLLFDLEHQLLVCLQCVNNFCSVS